MGEWILGSIPAQIESQNQRKALVITGMGSSPTPFALSRELRGNGSF